MSHGRRQCEATLVHYCCPPILCYVDALYHVMHAFMYKCPAPQVIEIEVK